MAILVSVVSVDVLQSRNFYCKVAISTPFQSLPHASERDNPCGLLAQQLKIDVKVKFR